VLGDDRGKARARTAAAKVGAVQVDSLKTRVESAYDFSA